MSESPGQTGPVDEELVELVADLDHDSRRATEVAILRDVEAAFALFVRGVTEGKIRTPFGLPRMLAKPLVETALGLVIGLRSAIEGGGMLVRDAAAEARREQA